MARNETLVAVREFARFPSVFPGGYPKVLIMSDGECLCSQCVKENYRRISQSTRDNDRDGWQAGGVVIHWEGEPLICAQCGKEIESAYGTPDNE